jgi:carboxyl-terminal processing protease
MFTVFVCLLIAVGCVATRTAPVTTETPAPATTNLLSPGPNDARIAYVTARLMKEFNYSQLPLDAQMSKKIFDGYVDSLDPRHENFLQSDVDEFSHYRTNLDTFLVSGNAVSDLSPAFEIFQRFLERTEQHAAYVDELLKQDKFKFTDDDRFMLDRRHEPFPKDMNEAQELWQERLRYEYLQEKLAAEISPTNSEVLLPLAKSNYTDFAATLAKHYRSNLHAVTNWDGDNVLQAYLNALTHAYDPHSDYLNAPHAQDFSIGMSLSLFGIGAQLTEDDGYCTINSLVHGGPAEKGKQLNVKDRIIAVAQSNQPPVNVVDMELDRVVQKIRGPKGTEVRLTISPAEDRAARRVISLVRDEIKLEDSEAKAKLIERTDARGGTNRIGIIDLPSFYAPVGLSGNEGHSPKFTSVDVAKLITKLKQEKVSGIILDLRSNPGGSLEEAVKFTGLFIKDGPVVLARNTDGGVNVDADTDSDELYDGPLVVLVNRFSASASEIAAAALQDYGRALIVGDTSTFGKGTVQSLTDLKPYVWPANKTATNDPGTVKITIRKFYRVSGASTQWKGVEPDIVLPDPLSYNTDIESERTLDNSLQWDTIQPVKYDKLNLVQPYLAELERRSAARIATNKEFIYIRQDIAEQQKSQTNKTVTLNERDALKERQLNAARDKVREADRNARKPLDEKIYDITVENSDQPVLPEPEPIVTVTTNGAPMAVSYSSYQSYHIDDTNLLTRYFATNAIGLTNITWSDLLSAGTTNAGIHSITNTIPIKIAITPILPDPTLKETEQILEDYILLLSKSGIMMADQ